MQPTVCKKLDFVAYDCRPFLPEEQECIFTLMKLFENKVVVVTGGAHGIGASIVSEFEKEGANVVYIDIRENPCFVGDLSKKETLEKFAQFVIEKYDHVDVLVNNALPLMKGIDE